MSQSLLLQLARESITEVLEAQNRIDKEALFEQYPLLKEPISSFVSIYLDNELRGSRGTITPRHSLLDDIIHNAKAAAFEDTRFSPLKTSEYLRSSIELSLLIEPKEITYRDIDELRQKLSQGKEALIFAAGGNKTDFLPQVWSESSSFEEYLARLLQEAGLEAKQMRHHPKIFSFQIEKERDTPILS